MGQKLSGNGAQESKAGLKVADRDSLQARPGEAPDP
jgi:hypothetical protein